MRTAAVYCRVSSDHQEKEGTSLTTQLDACLKYCQDKGYDVAYRFSETYSGLTMERPKLTELRDLVRDNKIDIIIVYCLDRLSRDPTHGVIITEELEKHHVTLEAVIESVDSSELGKLISYIRGFASKLEAEKIRERTMRGKLAKAKQGHWPGGGASNLFGYNYLKANGQNGGRRVINEEKAHWVRQMFQWLIDEGLSTYAITYRLRAENVPTPSGKGFWIKSSVTKILNNIAYAGKTYVFTRTYAETNKRRKPDTKRKLSHSVMKPKEEWLEIPGFTPPIISEETFEAAQKQLQLNRQNSKRNTKREYLLRGHLRCRRCGWGYSGSTVCVYLRDGTHYLKRAYRCLGAWKIHEPVNRCHNHNWGADQLEGLVWAEIQKVLDKPEYVITEIEKQRQDSGKLGGLEIELERVDGNFRALQREQEQLLQWALKGFPEGTVISENKRINDKRTSLTSQKAELEERVKASREAAISFPKLEAFIDLVRNKLTVLDFDTKRLALDMLDIKVWLDGYNIEITGSLPIVDVVTKTTPCGRNLCSSTAP
jgi:site-specific DNA recombinase